MQPKDYLFTLNLKFDSKKNAWAYYNEEANRTFYFKEKPQWAKCIEKCNEELINSKDPLKVRKSFDDLLEIAKKSDNVYSGHLDVKKIDSYLASISDINTLNPLKKIFELKLNYEVKSSLNSGSLASSNCNQMRKYSNILECINKRIKLVSLLSDKNYMREVQRENRYGCEKKFRTVPHSLC